jgi:hypothetical protein
MRHFWFLAALLLAWAAPAAAQGTPATGTGEVVGRVVDAATLTPLRGAQVRMAALRRTAVSDSNGVFRIARLPLGDHTTLVTRLGYRTMVSVWRVGAEGLELEVPLEVEPLALEAIRVEGRRFERRVRSSGRAARGFATEELAMSTAPDARTFVRSRMGMGSVSCGALSTGGPQDCVLVRGQPVRPCIIIDERRSYGGWDELELYRPQELYRIDVLSGGAVIQVYTSQYVRRMNTAKWTPTSADILTMTAC